jgi:predicted CXXCH cytochrome family protein
MKSRLLFLVFSITLAACAGVLGLRKPGSIDRPFEHRAHVTRGVSCVSCHAGVASSGRGEGTHFPTSDDCRLCHTKPHDERACEGCHGEPHVRGGAELASRHLKFEHKTHMLRVKGDCVRCHVAVGAPSAEALRPQMGTCFGCHAHQDQWRTRDCESCHVDLPAERVLPSSHLVHEGDWIREHGVRASASRDLCATCHSERSCAACHGVTTPALPWKLDLGGDPQRASLHRAGFRSRHAEEARGDPGACTTCHTESSCLACHEKERAAPGFATKSPHPAGWIGTARGGGRHGIEARTDPAACAGCHGGAGEALCVGCHRVGGPGGSPHGRGFASNKDKRHDVPCRQCHGAGP